MERSWVKLPGLIVLLLHVQYSIQQSLVIFKNFSRPLPIQPNVLINGGDYTTITNGVLELFEVSGPTDGDQGTSYIRPIGCTNPPLYFPPSNYFCLNVSNGDIYLTKWYIDRPPKFNSTYIVKINLINITKAIVQYAVSIQLLLPSCISSKPLSYILNPIGSSVCNSYLSSVQLSQVTALPNVTFNLVVTEAMLSIVGFSVNFPSQYVLNVSTSPKVLLQIEDKMKNKFYFTSEVLDVSKVQYITTRLKTVYNIGDLFTITLGISDLSQTLAFPSRSTFKVVYISDWTMCSTANYQCLENYLNFNKTYSSCNIPDPDFLYSYEKCFDLQPKLRVPMLTSFNVICNYYLSIVGLRNFGYFMLFNDTVLASSRFSNSRQPLRKRRDLFSLNETVTLFFSMTYKYKNGYFQCGLNDTSLTRPLMLSEKLNVNIPDLYFSPLNNSYAEFVAGSALVVPKCHFASTVPTIPIKKIDIFWVKDGVSRINATEDPTALEANGVEQFFLFPSLQIEKATFSDGGIYQCAVQIADQMVHPVFSDKFKVKINAQVVEFLSKIEFQNYINSAILFNCTYKAQQDLSAFSYWLFNGVTKLFGSSTLKRRSVQYEVAPLRIESYNMIGSYQCVIFDNNTMDRDFTSEAFVIPKQPDPVFVNNPSLNVDGIVQVGHFNSIIGCIFDTYFELKDEDIYFIKDDTYKLFTTSYLENESKLPPYRYRFADLNIERISYSDLGYYQCTINITGYSMKEIRSDCVDLQLPDTSNTKLILKLNRPWINEYLSQSSATFKDLKNVVEESIKQVALTIVKSTMSFSPAIIVQVTELSPGSVESVNVISRLTLTNVSDFMKLQLSNIIIQNISVNSFKHLDAVSVELISLDYCPKSSFGDVNYKGEYTFEQTLANQVVQQNCTYQSKGFVRRKCVGNLKDGPAWETPDLSQCEPKSLTTMKLIQLSEVVICVDKSTTACSPVDIISKNLNDIVVNSSAITNFHDVSLIANTLETIVNVSVNTSTASEQVFKDVLQTIDSLLESNATLIAESQVATSSSTSILNTLTLFAELYAKQADKKLQISNRNIAFYIEKVRRGVVTLSAQQLSNGSVEVSFENIDLNKVGTNYAYIQIPSEVFSNESEVIHSYFFRYDSFFLSESKLLKLVGKNVSGELLIQSTILSATVGSKTVANLITPVILTFKRTQSLELSGVSSCHFWDGNFETNIKNVFGAWLQDGCYKYEAGINNDEFYTCACDHLTNFALLLDVNQNSENPLALKIITFIGCGISLVGLSLTLLTLFVFRNLRQKLPPKILICLCISLSGLLLTFLIGAEKTSPRRGCQVIAAIIHFFILSTFCWMLVEAFNLYRSFVTVFKKSGDTNVLRNASIFAWGVPAIIVIIAGILKPDQLGNDKVCVIRGYPFYFGVLLPVCLIVLVNFVVLIVTILSLTKRVSTGKETTAKEYYLSQARIAFMCATLLGSSWLFAVLAVKDLSSVFQWLFCITTSLQGFFIFVFYILRNKEARTEWRRCFGVKKQHSIVSSSDPRSYELSTPH